MRVQIVMLPNARTKEAELATENSFTYLERHELVVRPRGPRVNLNAVAESNNEELDPLVADYLEVHGTVQITDVDPAVPPFDLLLNKEWKEEKKKKR